MTCRKTQRRCVFLAVLLVIGIVFGAMPIASFAAQKTRDFSKTDIAEDLKTAVVGGKPFDFKDYPLKENAKAEVINLVEYCYSYKADKQDHFGLYIYLYNPSARPIVDSEQNRVQMAVSYDSEGKVLAYDKFQVELCDKTEGDKENLFYKFKIIDRELDDGTTIVERVNSIERQYDISGIEVWYEGDYNATDIAVKGSYRFTGYAAGYGPDETAQESTLSSDIAYLESIELKVQHTCYRTKTSIKGSGYQTQLDSVYFAVPNAFFEKYKKLQKIKAEWWEYKTKDIIVTDIDIYYDWLKEHIGTEADYGNDTYALAENFFYGEYLKVATWSWGLPNLYHSDNPIDAFYYLFFTDDISSYDPYLDVTTNGGISSNELYEWIKNYPVTESGSLPVKNGTLSTDLFESDIDDNRKIDNAQGKVDFGYSYYNFDADVDLQTWQSWEDGNPSFWDNFFYYGWGDHIEETGKTLPPIAILTDEDMAKDAATMAEDLCIGVQDVPSLQAFYKDAKANNETVVLFRFATSDYYSAPISVLMWRGNGRQPFEYSDYAYRAQQSVFFDFDIIELTFNKDGEYFVIPVVSNPIDIVNAVTPPTIMPKQEGLPWWLLVIVLLLVLMLCFPIILPLVTLLVRLLLSVLTLPLKIFLKSGTRALGRAKDDRRRRKEKKPRDKEREERRRERQAEREKRRLMRKERREKNRKPPPDTPPTETEADDAKT